MYLELKVISFFEKLYDFGHRFRCQVISARQGVDIRNGIMRMSFAFSCLNAVANLASFFHVYYNVRQLKQRYMALRILMTGDDYNYLRYDAEMLRQRGFRVYFCDRKQILAEMIDEVKPDIVFINSKTPGKDSTDIYHNLIDNIVFASLPVIYTLSEDDVYLVNRKRTAIKERRYMMSDNIIDAIKMAIEDSSTSVKRRMPVQPPFFNNLPNARRA